MELLTRTNTIEPSDENMVEEVREVDIRGEGFGLDLAREEYTNREIGDKGEDVVAYYIEQRGMEVLERNWRCTFGEVDIIARDGNTIVLLEVKSRLATYCEEEIEPEQAVRTRKRNKYEKLALIYLSKQVEVDSVRFDVAAVKFVDKNTARIRYIVGAYEWDY
ncbi:MAG: YraN family protein [Atopobiaceae bacterium]|nr:YraN family protein [Atopobiaceae bacterium]